MAVGTMMGTAREQIGNLGQTKLADPWQLNINNQWNAGKKKAEKDKDKPEPSPRPTKTKEETKKDKDPHIDPQYPRYGYPPTPGPLVPRQFFPPDQQGEEQGPGAYRPPNWEYGARGFADTTDPQLGPASRPDYTRGWAPQEIILPGQQPSGEIGQRVPYTPPSQQTIDPAAQRLGLTDVGEPGAWNWRPGGTPMQGPQEEEEVSPAAVGRRINLALENEGGYVAPKAIGPGRRPGEAYEPPEGARLIQIPGSESQTSTTLADARENLAMQGLITGYGEARGESVIQMPKTFSTPEPMSAAPHPVSQGVQTTTTALSDWFRPGEQKPWEAPSAKGDVFSDETPTETILTPNQAATSIPSPAVNLAKAEGQEKRRQIALRLKGVLPSEQRRRADLTAQAQAAAESQPQWPGFGGRPSRPNPPPPAETPQEQTGAIQVPVSEGSAAVEPRRGRRRMNRNAAGTIGAASASAIAQGVTRGKAGPKATTAASVAGRRLGEAVSDLYNKRAQQKDEEEGRQ